MKPSFVCLMAPGLHLSLASRRKEARHSPCQLWFDDRGGGRCARPYLVWDSFACCEIAVTTLLCDMASWTGLSVRRVCLAWRKRATTPRWRAVTYVRVVVHVGWVWVFAVRQLELDLLCSLRGALYGSCVNYTAMARRLVWQQLTLDLSSPVPNSQPQTLMRTHTDRPFPFVWFLLKRKWKKCISLVYVIWTTYVCTHRQAPHTVWNSSSIRKASNHHLFTNRAPTPSSAV